eukprot:66752_1
MGSCNSKKNNIHYKNDFTRQNAKEKTQFVYVIGYNEYGELGIKNKKATFTLTSWNKHNKRIKIKSIHCSIDTIIFRDYKNNYFVTGNNIFGQCGINTFKPIKITQPKQITYFKQHNIIIIKICTNISSQCVFWITNKHQAYAHGRNQYYQLGLGDKNDRIYPEIIKHLTGIIDIECANKYSIAICNISNIVPIILKYWLSDNINVNIPQDMIQLTQMFCDINEIYKTRYVPGLIEYDTGNKTWKRLDDFQDKNIIKIACGINYTLLLDNTGVIWGYGINYNGQLGLNRIEIVTYPAKIKYFSIRNVRIKDMKCGQYHSIALDVNGNVHVWGDNKWFQLGIVIDNINNVNKPKSPNILQKKNVIKIGVGSRHSYCMTKEGICYFWGSNWYKECLQFGRINITTASAASDDIGVAIQNVYLGNQTTIVITDSQLKI